MSNSAQAREVESWTIREAKLQEWGQARLELGQEQKQKGKVFLAALTAIPAESLCSCTVFIKSDRRRYWKQLKPVHDVQSLTQCVKLSIFRFLMSDTF